MQMGAGLRSFPKNGFLEKHKPAVYFVNFITLREKKNLILIRKREKAFLVAPLLVNQDTVNRNSQEAVDPIY